MRKHERYDPEMQELLNIEITSLIANAQHWFSEVWLTEQVMQKFMPDILKGKGLGYRLARMCSHRDIKAVATRIFKEHIRTKENYVHLPYFVPIVRNGEAGWINLEYLTDAEFAARIHRLDMTIDGTVRYRDEMYEFWQKLKQQRNPFPKLRVA